MKKAIQIFYIILFLFLAFFNRGNSQGGMPPEDFVNAPAKWYMFASQLPNSTYEEVVISDFFLDSLGIGGALSTIYLSDGTLTGNRTMDLSSYNLTFDNGGLFTFSGRISQIDLGHSVFIGEDAGLNDDLTNNYNVGVGYLTLITNTTGINNVGVGKFTLRDNLGGSFNLGLGYECLYENISGNYNTAIGGQSLKNNLSGIGNTAIGNFSGLNTLGDYNVFIGYGAGYNETGSDKLYIDPSTTTTPLIYGDFSTNIARINGTLQINDPSSTGFSFPIADGTASYFLQTNGSGVVSWASGTASVNTIYSANDALISTRIVDLSTFDLSFNGTGTLQTNAGLLFDGTIGTVTDGINFTSSNNAIYEGVADNLYFKAGTNNSLLLSSTSAIIDADLYPSITNTFDLGTPTYKWATFSSDNIYDDGTEITFNSAYSFPILDGSSSQYLQTDGAGNVSWAAGAGGATQLTDLSDVNTATPTDKFFLIADGIDWESRALVKADISDYSTPTLTEVLTAGNTSTLTMETGTHTINGTASQLYVGDGTNSSSLLRFDYVGTSWNMAINSTHEFYMYPSSTGTVGFSIKNYSGNERYRYSPYSATMYMYDKNNQYAYKFEGETSESLFYNTEATSDTMLYILPDGTNNVKIGIDNAGTIDFGTAGQFLGKNSSTNKLEYIDVDLHPYARYYLDESGDWTIPLTPAAPAPIDNESFDPDGHYSITSNEIVVSETGYYEVNFTGQVNNAAGSDYYVTARWRLNQSLITNYGSLRQNIMAGEQSVISMSDIIYVDDITKEIGLYFQAEVGSSTNLTLEDYATITIKKL